MYFSIVFEEVQRTLHLDAHGNDVCSLELASQVAPDERGLANAGVADNELFEFTNPRVATADAIRLAGLGRAGD